MTILISITPHLGNNKVVHICLTTKLPMSVFTHLACVKLEYEREIMAKKG